MIIMPTTKFGKISFKIFCVGVVSFVVMNLVVMSGQTGGDKFSDNWLISLPALITGVSFIIAGAISAFSIYKNNERSISSYLITLIGALLILFLIGEFTVPH